MAGLSLLGGSRAFAIMSSGAPGIGEVTHLPGSATHPAWSPDGSWIVFTSDRDGSRKLYAMSPEGTEDQAVLLADLEGEQWSPAWQPSPPAMDREDPSPTPAATPPEEEPPAAACFNGDAGVPADGATRGPLVGDVDGDGSDDRVYVEARLDAAESCRYLLVAETEERRYEARLRERGFGEVFDLFLRPLLLAEIDGREGMEIVLEIHRGAARSFLRVFTMTREGPAAIELQAQPGRPFEYGGSGSGIAAVDCAPQWGEGLISVLEAAPEARGTYFVTQKLYLVEGTSFVPEHQVRRQRPLRRDHGRAVPRARGPSLRRLRSDRVGP